MTGDATGETNKKKKKRKKEKKEKKKKRKKGKKDPEKNGRKKRGAAPLVGVEPTTTRLKAVRSTN